jgi:hypothetical protein
MNPGEENKIKNNFEKDYGDGSAKSIAPDKRIFGVLSGNGIIHHTNALLTYCLQNGDFAEF